MLPNANATHFCDIILDVGGSYRPVQENYLENQKSGSIRINCNNILSVISQFCLSVCRGSTAYTRLCRSLKYLLKVRYIIVNVARFLIFETFCLCRAKTLTYVWKNITKMNGIWVCFTKLSQNACRINTHSLIYWNSGCNCKLWKGLSWFYCVFGYFHTLRQSCFLSLCRWHNIFWEICQIT